MTICATLPRARCDFDASQNIKKHWHGNCILILANVERGSSFFATATTLGRTLKESRHETDRRVALRCWEMMPRQYRVVAGGSVGLCRLPAAGAATRPSRLEEGADRRGPHRGRLSARSTHGPQAGAGLWAAAGSVRPAAQLQSTVATAKQLSTRSSQPIASNRLPVLSRFKVHSCEALSTNHASHEVSSAIRRDGRAGSGLACPRSNNDRELVATLRGARRR